jgi:hypothetical protein
MGPAVQRGLPALNLAPGPGARPCYTVTWCYLVSWALFFREQALGYY